LTLDGDWRQRSNILLPSTDSRYAPNDLLVIK
jgi:hypothetical protein